MELSRIKCARSDDVVAKPCNGSISGKTLDADGRHLSSIIPGTWRSLLKNVFQARLASNVFSSKVFPAGSPHLPAVLSFEFWRPAVRRKQISCRGRRPMRNGSITVVIV